MNNKLKFLDFEDALEQSLELSKQKTYTEIIPISKALGRVIAKDIICKKNLPSFNNSAMDGFALNFSDAGKKLKINKIIFAGDKNIKQTLKPNECYKIMTGAMVPNDADTIVPIEKCNVLDDDFVEIPENIKLNDNFRFKGEEQKQGDTIFSKGEEINSSHIALLASQGIIMVEVFTKISIAVLSTGNEIKEPWESADEEEIYNCNSFAIIALLQEYGFDATYSGVVPDNLEKSTKFIEKLKTYDVIITSGGISAGDADFVEQAFVNNGLKTKFHGVNIKPGKPIMMGEMENTAVVCLPGNPLTAMINTFVFTIPMLKKIQGSSSFYHDVVLAENLQEFNVKNKRVNFVLGNLENGGFKVTRNNKYGSGMISALYESNCLFVSSMQTSTVSKKQMINVIRFTNKLINKKLNILN